MTLVARPPSRASSRAPEATQAGVGSGPQDQRIISGTCSGDQPLINRLGRFETSFVPEGTLLICENYDSPGKIGVVGSLLGQEGVNINFMTVAPVSRKFVTDVGDSNEALMILGIDKVVEQRVLFLFDCASGASTSHLFLFDQESRPEWQELTSGDCLIYISAVGQMTVDPCSHDSCISHSLASIPPQSIHR